MIVAAIETTQAAVIAATFALITVVGLYAGRWRRASLDSLDEWALGGRQFGAILTWFLQGGSVYTTYSFIAVPALVYGGGALGFFALPYLVIAYTVAFLVVPKLWELARVRGYVTPADFVRDRFRSRSVAAAVTVTGIVATMPYVALQVYGIELCMAQIGLPVNASLWTAFVLLAVITYVSGLRSATLIAIVKDVFIWVAVIVAVIYIPIHLGGYRHAFAHVPRSQLTLPGNLYADYATLAVGSGLALFLYPHTLTGALSSSSKSVVQRNSVFLPIYTIMLGLLAILGYLAVAAGIEPSPHYGNNNAIPALFDAVFPAWFAGFGLAAIAIGALVPAAMMAIASANLFARNIWLELKPNASAKEQTDVSKAASLVVKFGAVGFVLFVPTTFVINFQLAAGIWILQTLPSVFLGLLRCRLGARGVLAGWAVGTAIGTFLLVKEHFTTSSFDFGFGAHHTRLFIGVPALAANLAVVLGAALVQRLRTVDEVIPVPRPRSDRLFALRRGRMRGSPRAGAVVRGHLPERSRMERSAFVKGYTKILTNAWSDNTFKQRLQSDPKSVLPEFGLSVPASATVNIVTTTAGEGSLDDQVEIWERGESTGTYTLYVPEVPQVQAGELSEAELDTVSGAGDTYCCCCSPCCTCT